MISLVVVASVLSTGLILESSRRLNFLVSALALECNSIVSDFAVPLLVQYMRFDLKRG